MPKDSLNIYMTIQDGMSPALASITDKTKALDKETQQLQQTTNAMTKASQSLLEKQTRLQSEYDSSKKRLKEFQKAYDEHQDELSKANLDHAIQEHAKLKNELMEVTEQLNANKRAYKENVEAVRKGGLSTSVGMGDLSSSAGAGGVMNALFASQIGQMWGSAAGDVASLVTTSALGTPTASLLSEAASGAITGAIAGSVIPGVGTAAGAALGGIAGAISGGTKIFEAKDDAFKDYYGGLYEDVSARPEQMITAGSSTAAGREKDQISFTTLFGDRQVAGNYLDNLVDMANYTPFLYDDLTAMSKTLATYGYSAQKDPEKERAGEADNNYILDTLQTIGDTGAALGMGTSDMTAVATALGRMKSSDKTTLEYLNILNDRGIGAVGMLADAKGVSVGDMYKMISGGEVAGSEAVEIITAAMRDAYAGSMEKQSKTFEGITSTLEGLEQELENAGGEGYNTLRQSGKSAMVDAYGGELGDALKEVNAVLGENQARKENLQDQYYRDVMGAVLSGSRGETWNELDEDQQNTLTEMNQQYTALKTRYEESGKTDAEAGAELESLYEQAEALAQSYFDNSEFVKMLNDTELDEVQAILDNTAGLQNATQAAYNLTQQLSKGMGSSFFSYAGRASGDSSHSVDPTKPVTSFSNSMSMRGLPANWTPPEKSHAFGLNRVPFDDYPALLHEGERVLTAREAREQDRAEFSTLTMQRPADDVQAGTDIGTLLMERPAPNAGSTPESGGTTGGEAGLGVNISGNTFVGASEEMADQLWEIIVRKLEREFKAAGR